MLKYKCKKMPPHSYALRQGARAGPDEERTPAAKGQLRYAAGAGGSGAVTHFLQPTFKVALTLVIAPRRTAVMMGATRIVEAIPQHPTTVLSL